MRGFVHHIDLTVTDLARSRPFYETFLGFMGYVLAEEFTDGRGYDFQCRSAAGYSSIGIVLSQGANAARTHDRNSPGLHHLAWHAGSREDVDAFYALLQEMGATILDAPADYPRYAPVYYAVFFADPDGLKLEYVYRP